MSDGDGLGALERASLPALGVGELLVEQMQEAVITVGLDHKVQSWSRGAERVYGFAAEEAIGQAVFSLIRPELDVADFQRFVDELTAKGCLRETAHRVRKDGRVIQVETTFVLLRDGVGAPSGILGVARDVSEPEALSRALRESEARIRSLVSAMAEGVVAHDAGGRIVDCNEAAEQILGPTRAQMEGQSSMDPTWRAVHEDGSSFPGEEHPAMVTLRTGEAQRNVIMGVHRPDGSLRWISVSSAPLRLAPDLGPQGVVATFTDVTALKQATAEQERLVVELREALAQVKTLTGLLPICMFCKKIRDEHGEWRQLEQYLASRTDAKFSHGLCPTCEDEHYPPVPPRGEPR